MYKKTISYQTYDDIPETITEDFYFNLNETEITELQNGVVGGLVLEMNEIFANRDTPKMMEFFKRFILKAYGKRTPDGKRLIKTQEVIDEFYYSDAYNKLFTELFSDDTGEKIPEFMSKVTGTEFKEMTQEQLNELRGTAPTLASMVDNIKTEE